MQALLVFFVATVASTSARHLGLWAPPSASWGKWASPWTAAVPSPAAIKAINADAALAAQEAAMTRAMIAGSANPNLAASAAANPALARFLEDASAVDAAAMLSDATGAARALAAAKYAKAVSATKYSEAVDAAKFAEAAAVTKYADADHPAKFAEAAAAAKYADAAKLVEAAAAAKYVEDADAAKFAEAIISPLSGASPVNAALIDPSGAHQFIAAARHADAASAAAKARLADALAAAKFADAVFSPLSAASPAAALIDPIGAARAVAAARHAEAIGAAKFAGITGALVPMDRVAFADPSTATLAAVKYGVSSSPASQLVKVCDGGMCKIVDVVASAADL